MVKVARREAVELQIIKTARKVGSPELGFETAISGVFSIVVSPPSGIGGFSSLWVVWGIPI